MRKTFEAERCMGHHFRGQFNEMATQKCAAIMLTRGRRGLMQVTDELVLMTVGVAMEQSLELLQTVNAEVEVSRATLRELENEILALRNVLHPQMISQVEELRGHRMAIVREVRDALAALRDIRDFFMGADYSAEMDRLERFVRVCRDIQALKADGTFDAVVDSALRLAVKP